MTDRFMLDVTFLALAVLGLVARRWGTKRAAQVLDEADERRVPAYAFARVVGGPFGLTFLLAFVLFEASRCVR